MIRTTTRLLAAAALFAPVTAEAAPTVTSTPWAAYAAPAQGAVIDFDHALPTGFTLTGGLVRTVDDSLGAQPAIAPGVKGASMYWSINAGDPGTLMSDVGYRTVSFLWGSMDAYNRLTLLGAGGAVLGQWSGLDVYVPSDGDQWGAATNRRVTFSADQAIHGLRLESDQPAFEIDDVAFDGAVPEPATWGTMLLGFGGLGSVLRRRRAPGPRVRFA